MSPATLFAAVAGVLVTGGILLGVWAWQPRPERPTRPHRQGRLSKWWAQVSPVRRLTILAAALVGLLLALTTGWMVAVVALPAAALGLPTILMSSGEARSLARLGAIADWTRNLAGIITAGQKLEGAIAASVRSTPEEIRPEVGRLAARLRARWSTESALRAFADDLHDVTGDLVASALILASAKRGDGLSLILTGLAESVSDAVRTRRQLEADRAKPRAAARAISLISVVALLLLSLSGEYLAPYGTVAGQLVLAALLSLYAANLAWLRRMSRPDLGHRLLGAEARAGAGS
jgi:Flp pilus assembly protein TadB